MNWDIVEGNWKQIKGKVQRQWGEITGDRLEIIAGKHAQMAGAMQESFGVIRSKALRNETRRQSPRSN
jgi:uncharacterized protein YjbJ (UPF0337 family)